MKHFDAVIFDLDGTLLDTERVAQEAFFRACAELSVTPRTDLLLRCVGAAEPIARRVIQEGYGPHFDAEAFFAAWSRYFTELGRQTPTPLKEGALALLDTVAQLGLPLAIATSSRTEHAVEKLRQAGLLERFRAVIGADQVHKPKPDPEVYLTAARQLGVDPRDCLALEDSEYGVRAAHAAGMTVIQIPDLTPPTSDLRALGHIVLASLKEVAGYPFPAEDIHG
ncbi:MAG TPA: HAD family phosphatase [Steroidobacteraceae bacterium]|jgi:HAD superfamily hydrolase (TIGR01509 family)|nr:HAD family phosphatase [Steroidobacteraceae bacterium]